MDYSLPGSSVHEDSPGKNTGMGCHALLQGIFPTQGSNPGLPHCMADSLLSEPPGKSKNTGVCKLIPSPGELSRPKNQTGVSCIASWFFTKCAIREARLSGKLRCICSDNDAGIGSHVQNTGTEKAHGILCGSLTKVNIEGCCCRDCKWELWREAC